MPEPTLPTAPGLYRDKDEDEWALTSDGRWYLLLSTRISKTSSSAADVTYYLPLTLITPAPTPTTTDTEPPTDAFADAIVAAGYLVGELARVEADAQVRTTISLGTRTLTLVLEP